MKNRQNNNFPPLSSERLMHLFKGWRKATRYSSIFAAVPALIAGNSQDVRAEEGVHDSQTASRERGNLPRRRTIKPKFLGTGQNFANSRGAALSNLLANGSDGCPGTPIPTGTYTAASPYVDTGDTTGANNTVTLLTYYYWYEYAADGPDRIYSFKVNSLGADPKITVTTTSPTYRPMIYVLSGCPDGQDNTVTGWWALHDSRWTSGNTAEVAPSWLQLGGQYYLFVDSQVANESGAYTLTLKDMQIESTGLVPDPDPPERTNFALASKGGVASASSAYPGHNAAGVNNGDRKGLNWGGNGGWNDNTLNVYPDWLQIDFNGTKTIDEIDVFAIQDNYGGPSEPDENMNFTLYGNTHFEIQYWDGAGWVTVPGGGIANTNKIWTKVTFPAISTTKIRVHINNSLASYSRLAEVEAWGGGVAPTPDPTPDPGTRTNFALVANGGAASASSEYPGHNAAGVNNGDRKGLNWGGNGGWNDNTLNVYPDWLQIDFNGTKTIDEIDVFAIQDNYGGPSEPDENMNFTLYGNTHFEIQYWDGAGWVTVPGGGIANTNKIWTKVTFPAISTTKIRVHINNSLASYSRLAEVEAWGIGTSPSPTPTVPPTPTPTPTNFALASRGGVASASSEYSGFPASAINNGDHKGLNWANGGEWVDNSRNVYPDSVQIDLAGAKTIDEIDVFAVQDNYENPSEPTLADTFTLYGVTAFDVQYWNGSAWITVPGGSITANNKVWTKVTFTPIQTTKIRVLVNNALQNYSRLIEVEAWGSN